MILASGVDHCRAVTEDVQRVVEVRLDFDAQNFGNLIRWSNRGPMCPAIDDSRASKRIPMLSSFNRQFNPGI